MATNHRHATPPVLGIVIPCFNESEVLGETCLRLERLLHRLIADSDIDRNSRVWFVDDGSRDETWRIIERASSAPGSIFCGIKLSRNRGHQIALLAGLLTAEGDALISLDADLQDDLEVIPSMIANFKAGYDIVYAVRSSRQSDTRFKRGTANGYYKLLQWLGVEIISNHADFRLMSRRTVEGLRQFGESNIFLRGLIPQLGFPSTTVDYVRSERFAGTTKYPLAKMFALAWQGITSFSAAPLRIITVVGVAVSFLSLALGVWALWVRLFSDEAVPGWASIVIPIFFISGVQLLSLGVIGEYIAKIFVETKRRPPYIVENITVPVDVGSVVHGSRSLSETDSGSSR